MGKAIEYLVPLAVLNKGRGYFDPMPHQDEVYRIPENWMKANASRFYFTDRQIIDAAEHEFDPGDTCAKFTKCCGVYFLIKSGVIVYVGISTHIPDRVDQHMDRGIDFDSITWFEAPELYLREIESYYIRRIQPSINIDLPRYNRFGKWVSHLELP